jgi:hypothetical protein
MLRYTITILTLVLTTSAFGAELRGVQDQRKLGGCIAGNTQTHHVSAALPSPPYLS